MNLTKDSVLSEKRKLHYPSMIFLEGKYQESSSGKTFSKELCISDPQTDIQSVLNLTSPSFNSPKSGISVISTFLNPVI